MGKKRKMLPSCWSWGTFQGTKLPIKFQVSVFLENTHIFALLQRHSAHTLNSRIVYQLGMPWTYFRRQDLVSTAYLHLKSSKQCYFDYIIFWAALRFRNVRNEEERINHTFIFTVYKTSNSFMIFLIALGKSQTEIIG